MVLSNHITFVISSDYTGLSAFVFLASVFVCNITNRRQVVALVRWLSSVNKGVNDRTAV